METQVIILGHGRPYDFKNGKNEEVKGVKVSYINTYPSIDGQTRGFLPFQETFDPCVLGDLKEIPGVYDATWAMMPGKDNKPVSKIVALKLVKKYNFEV